MKLGGILLHNKTQDVFPMHIDPKRYPTKLELVGYPYYTLHESKT